MKILYNGELVDQVDSLCDRQGWMVGTGIFETIKTVDNFPWALSRHMRRVTTSAHRKGIKLPSEESVRSGIEAILSHEKFESGALRLSFSDDGNWCATHRAYQANNLPAKLISYKQTLTKDGQSIKSFPYDHRLKILEAARHVGADEAIVFNDYGLVCEGSVTNLLLCIGGEWITPPIGDGVLPGIVRALVIEYCGVKVRSIPAMQLVHVTSGFLLSSLRIAQPIGSIDGRELALATEFQAQIEAMAVRTSVG